MPPKPKTREQIEASEAAERARANRYNLKRSKSVQRDANDLAQDKELKRLAAIAIVGWTPGGIRCS
jgi:hypothetical protein